MVRQSSKISLTIVKVEPDLSAKPTTEWKREHACVLFNQKYVKKKKIIFIKIIKIIVFPRKLFFFFFFGLFWGTLMAYGGSQARGQIRAAADGLRHSNSNGESLHHSSWQGQILNTLSKARDGTHNLMVTSKVH